MKVALCCIGRLENRYVREYVTYYMNIGVDKIFIYDNNHDGEETFEEAIGDFVTNGFVSIINFRNKEAQQLKAYQDCYDKHKDEYDWLCFFDFDEFLTFKEKDENIKTFLGDACFANYNMIHINWLVYSDNDIVYYEDKPLTERFTKPVMPLDFELTYNFPENNHIKTILRGGLDGVKWNSTPHTPKGVKKCCNALGNECMADSPFNPYDFNRAWLRHFQTKTIQEWLELKMRRGVGDRTRESFEKTYQVDNFFVYNKKTEEKEEIIKEYKNFMLNKELDIFICTHKDFKKVVSHPCYKVINVKEIDYNELGLKCNDEFHCELAAYLWIVKHYKIKKYIGFCHYRRYFSFMDSIPDMDSIFETCDAVLPAPTKCRVSVKENYGICHNKEDLDIIEEIVKEWFPAYYGAVNTAFNKNNMLFTNNMFIMKREDFLEFMTLYKNVIDRYLTYIGGDVEKRINENKDKYLKDIEDNPQNNEVWYQKRIGGYVAERLLTAFVIKNFKKIKLYNINLTEKKYNMDKIDEKYE